MWGRVLQMCSWCSYREHCMSVLRATWPDHQLITFTYMYTQDLLLWLNLLVALEHIFESFSNVAEALSAFMIFPVIQAYLIAGPLKTLTIQNLYLLCLLCHSPSRQAQPPTSHWSWSRWSTLRQASMMKFSRRWREPRCPKLCLQRWPPTRARWVSRWENRSQKMSNLRSAFTQFWTNGAFLIARTSQDNKIFTAG